MSTIRYCGREFTSDELAHITTLAATLPTRRAIADAPDHALQSCGLPIGF